MPEEIPFQIGDEKAQAIFRQNNKDFLDRFPTLVHALNVAFDRDYNAKTIEDALIFDLSRLCADRFSEIGTLSANGLGKGAYIILRSMFEHLVTARYIHLHPNTANDFVDYVFVHIHKVHNQVARTHGQLPIQNPYAEELQKHFERVRERFVYKRQSKSSERLKSGWTDMGTVDMAIHVGLGEYLYFAYSRPIEIAHPSMITLFYDPEQQQHDPSHATMIAHRLLIELLILQHEHFELSELPPLISQCLSDFSFAWRRYNSKGT